MGNEQSGAAKGGKTWYPETNHIELYPKELRMYCGRPGSRWSGHITYTDFMIRNQTDKRMSYQVVLSDRLEGLVIGTTHTSGCLNPEQSKTMRLEFQNSPRDQREWMHKGEREWIAVASRRDDLIKQEDVKKWWTAHMDQRPEGYAEATLEFTFQDPIGHMDENPDINCPKTERETRRDAEKKAALACAAQKQAKTPDLGGRYSKKRDPSKNRHEKKSGSRKKHSNSAKKPSAKSGKHKKSDGRHDGSKKKHNSKNGKQFAREQPPDYTDELDVDFVVAGFKPAPYVPPKDPPRSRAHVNSVPPPVVIGPPPSDPPPGDELSQMYWSCKETASAMERSRLASAAAAASYFRVPGAPRSPEQPKTAPTQRNSPCEKSAKKGLPPSDGENKSDTDGDSDNVKTDEFKSCHSSPAMPVKGTKSEHFKQQKAPKTPEVKKTPEADPISKAPASLGALKPSPASKAEYVLPSAFTAKSEIQSVQSAGKAERETPKKNAKAK